MKQTKTSALLIGVAALSLAGAGALSAQPAGRGPGDGGRPEEGAGRLMRAARFLELTEDQRTRVRELMEQGQPERQRLREESRAAGESFRQALETGNADPATVGEAAIRMHALRQQMRAAGEQFEQAFQALLTPEQQRKFELLEASRISGDGHGRRGRRGSHRER